jgi:hypothetical protein
MTGSHIPVSLNPLPAKCAGATVNRHDDDGSRARRAARIRRNGGLWPKPEPADLEGRDLTERQIGLLLAGSTDGPGRTLFDPAVLPRPLTRLRATYINCLKPDPAPHSDLARFADSPSWNVVDLDTGHWPMYSRPAELASLLDEIARKG